MIYKKNGLKYQKYPKIFAKYDYKTLEKHQQASGTCWEKGGFGWGKNRSIYKKNAQKYLKFPKIIA